MPRSAWFLFVSFLAFPCGSLFSGNGDGGFTVVIDPGHGGRDPGALGLKSKEKDINLAIALKLGELIRTSMTGVRVIYTRNTDHFVELYRRADIANDARANLFISIHCNASHNKSLSGAETYVMGLHKSEENLNIAKLENAAILLESDFRRSYDGFDPNSDESYIIFSLNQNANLGKSTNFAAMIQEELSERTGLRDRGVRQAGFLVLFKTTMPSVLVENGYISNPAEEKFLMSQKGQDYIASAIFRAFRELVRPDVTTARSTIDTLPNTSEEKMPAAGALSFRVQIAAEAKDLPADASKFAVFRDVKMYRHGGLYKYTVGDATNLPSALILLEEVKKKGVRDAFIVIFRDGNRIPQAEADRLMRK